MRTATSMLGADPDQRPENFPQLAVGTGLATLALSVPFMAVGVGLIATSEPVHWALRVFLFVFTVPFVTIGGGLLVGGFALLVNDAVPGGAPFAIRGVRYLLGRMVMPRHLIAALPVALIVAQYLAVARTGAGWFGVGEGFLQRGIFLEFIAIHATGFLGVATIIPATGRWRIARIVSIAALALLYLSMAATAGWDAALFLAYLVAVKLGPFLLSPPDLHSGASLGLRWGFHMIVFLSVFTFFGGLESVRAGAVYWSAIGVAELLGMTDVEMLDPADTAAHG